MANVRKKPFHLGAMDQVEWFYNRRQEIRSALETLREKGNVEVVGPRRIGKTWFLRYISDSTVLRKHGVDPQRNLFVYMNCQRHLGQQKEAQVYRTMIDCVGEATQRTGLDLASQPWKDYETKLAFELVLKELRSRGIRLILVLDEFEEMARNPALDNRIFNHLRSLFGANDVSISYVTASSTTLLDLTLERQSLSSPFFNIFQRVRLGLFSEQDSQHLIEDSLHRADTTLPRDLVDLAMEVGGGHPYFLQMAGLHACRLTATGEELTEDERRLFLGSFNAEATHHFDYYWQMLNHQDQQYILAALPLLRVGRSCRETINHLENICLITQRDGEYDYFSPLLETFVRRQEVKDLVQASPLLIDERRKRVLLRDKLLNLNSTSRALLTCLVLQAGQVVSYDELWRAAWSGEPYNLVEQVKSSISRLRSALEDDVIHIANRRGVGYILEILPE